jgi:hypothetical protein
MNPRTILHRVVWLIILAGPAFAPVPRAHASIPDADIRRGLDEAGFGVFDGAYGRVDLGISERSAVGGYVGVDANDVYFADFNERDRRFRSDTLVGGHYMYQFVEGVDGNPSVAGVFGAFANRAGLRPEVGLAVSYPFADRWTGRLNAVYGPSWGLEFGYHFTRNVQGTFGVTGMGLVGISARF